MSKKVNNIRASTTVITVSYNCKDSLRECLRSLPSDIPIIVIDNASQDGTQEMVEKEFPMITLIKNPKNYGFGRANNQGLAITYTDYALLLNPDTICKDGSITKLVEFMNLTPNAVACGGQLVFPDGEVQESASNFLTLWVVFCEQTYLERLFPKSRLFSPYWVSKKILNNNKTPEKVAQIMGACMMLRKIESKWPHFDERYFLYCEDTDLCFRISAYGSLWYVPKAIFVHNLGQSSLSNRWKAISYYNRGKELYFFSHHGIAHGIACFIMNRLGALFRFFFWAIVTLATLCIKPVPRNKMVTFLKVLFASIDPYKNAKKLADLS
jgi:GT2 family glycosyltransferase